MINLEWLNNWYQSQCNGDWEHGEAITIETIDNPGWAVMIDLNDSGLQLPASFVRKAENTETDWYHISLQDGRYKAFGDPAKLNFLLDEFRKLTETAAAA